MALDPRTVRTNATLRITFRAAGAVLLIAGIVLLVIGIKHLSDGVSSMQSNDITTSNSGTGFGDIVVTAAGGFLAIFGLAALRMGFLRAEVNYLAGEASGAIQNIAGDVAQGMHSSVGAGLCCPKCGVRNETGGHFCPNCGTAF